MIRQLMITGSNQHPAINDDWATSIPLDATKEYTKEELVDLVCKQHPHYAFHAMWLYEGPDYEDKTTGRKLASGTIVYDMAFHPWDAGYIKLIEKADLEDAQTARDDDNDEEWKQEIAMQAGMMGGCDAYNEVMGY